MKKLLVLLLAVLMLAGCSGKGDITTPTGGEVEHSISVYDYDTTDIPKPEVVIENPTGVLAKVLDQGYITVVTSPDNPPYEYIAEDAVTLSGSELYLAKYIADILGVELKLESVDFNACLTSLDTDKADISMAGYGWKKDRAENYELSVGYHAKESEASCHCLMVRAEDADKYSAVEEFNGKKVVAQAGSLHQMYVEDQIPEADLELVTGLDQAMLTLASGKADALATSCSTARQYAAQSEGTLAKSDAEFDLSMYADYEGTVVAAKKGETSMIDVLNQIFSFVNENGIYDIMYQQALDETGMIDGEE